MLQNIKNQVHGVKALYANIRYGFPSRSMKVIGITGTDGKTTTTELIYHILTVAGKKVSMISTVKAMINGKEYDTGFHVTTPTSSLLQKFFSIAKAGGSEFMVLEVTSHALDQKRVSGVKFDVGLITNISHEHLDYHKTFEEYVKAKAKLLNKTRVSILNIDDKNFEVLKNYSSGKIVTFGLKKADVTPQNATYETTLIGEFNTYNILASIAVARVFGVDEESIKKGIKTFKGIQGRMEEVKTDKNFKIIIDFAHKPNALESALKTLKAITENRLIVLFGSAGLRDRDKRPMMGKIAGKFADIAVITAEDPRTEDVREIIDAIARGAKSEGMIEKKRKKEKKNTIDQNKVFYKIPDRQEAINFAIRDLAQKGDIILLAGKGHEKSMCYGKTEYPWDEFKAVKKAIIK